MVSQAELLQRQPLLARKELEEAEVGAGGARGAGGDVVLELGGARQPDERFPKEVGKALASFLFMFGCVVVNMTSLALVHERLPPNGTAPLPDIVLDHVGTHAWALAASEYLIIVSTSAAMATVLLHRHRFIVARRLFFLIGLLYLYRSVTMFVTVLPKADLSYPCSPPDPDASALTIVRRVFYLISGFGLSINGHHVYCGDYIYSGHTMVLVLSYLVVAEYSPRRLWPLHWALWALAAAGVALLLVAHGHYTVDVVIAYYVTTRLFWAYHALLGCGSARHQHWLRREWWHPLSAWLEAGVRAPVPRRYDWPLRWPWPGRRAERCARS